MVTLWNSFLLQVLWSDFWKTYLGKQKVIIWIWNYVNVMEVCEAKVHWVKANQLRLLKSSLANQLRLLKVHWPINYVYWKFTGQSITFIEKWQLLTFVEKSFFDIR